MKKGKPRILYAGDSPAGGPANYLLAILGTLNCEFRHVPPGERLSAADIHRSDALVLSDYGRSGLGAGAEESIIELVEKRAGGLLMVGGWGSFTGLRAGWKGSEVERLLPVNCLARDDRRNIPTGLLVRRRLAHAVLKGLPSSGYPVLCGLNELKVKPGSKLVLSAAVLKNGPVGVSFDRREYPLLVVSSSNRTAALATDLAPHWCGGFVDWGKRRVTLPVCGDIRVEIGHYYLRFVQNLLLWLVKAV